MRDYSHLFSPNVYNFVTVDKINAEIELGTLNFKGIEYPCPNPEWYLEKRFKKWKKRIPKNGREWGYFAGEFLKGENYANL